MRKHLVFFSGGTGSWEVARRVKGANGSENLYLLFTDTLIEDNDLYRFLIESAAELFDIERTDVLSLIERASKLPHVYTDMVGRKKELEELRIDTVKSIPKLLWLSEQRDVWDVFWKQRFLGNSRIAPCSAELKQRMAKRYVKDNFDPADTTLYLGIDWTEEHRTKAPTKNWRPFAVNFPLCESPYVNKIDIMKELDKRDIEVPRLYGIGFTHNNCGGFCVRAGQGHFANLLDKDRLLFLYHEGKEQEFRDFVGKDVAILKRVRKGVPYPLTLRQLREELEGGNSEQIDFFDIGGCGCFVDEPEKP